jgi:hypothetical protein
MEIGKPRRILVVEPIRDPVPVQTPQTTPRERELEKVPETSARGEGARRS